MSTSTSPDLKQQHRAMWAAGRYADVAELVDGGPPEAVLAAAGAHGDVLDVACGTGNLALRAAERGAAVTGLDLVP
jgi:2-polyprenyl-3-methyl-5-hydroxy-6-metoxy-1,4-benzoquinol methylase